MSVEGFSFISDVTDDWNPARMSDAGDGHGGEGHPTKPDDQVVPSDEHLDLVRKAGLSPDSPLLKVLGTDLLQKAVDAAEPATT